MTAVSIAAPMREGSGVERAVRLVTGAARFAAPALFVAGLAFLVVSPLYRIQKVAVENDAAGYRTAFGSSGFGETLRTTILLALGSLAIAMVLGTSLAWAASQLPRRLHVLSAVPIMPIVVPAVANVVGWAFLFSPRPGYANAALRKLPWWNHLDEGPVDIYTLPWIVILTGFGLTAFIYLFVSAGLRNINSELIEAAQTSGSSNLQVFFRVILPLLRPVLVYGSGVSLLLGLGQFTTPLLLGRNNGIDVITTDIYRSMGTYPIDYAAAAAFGSPLLVFGVVVVVLQKVVLGDQRRFVTHGGKSFKSERKASPFAVAGILLYGTLATLLPILALTVVSLSKFWTGNIDLGELTGEHFDRVLNDAVLKKAITTSVVASLCAVAIALPVGYIAASIILRMKGRRVLRAATDLIVALPLGVPAVVFGAGFLLEYTQGPFVLYGTRLVIILVYVTLMLPFTTRMQLSGMVALGDAYVEASRTSGAGVLRTNLKIMLPLMKPTLASAGALMFVLLSHEFTASLLVRSSTTQVMGTALYDYWSNGYYPSVAAIALLMTAVTLVGVIIAVLVGGAESLSRL